jgi:repressor LexA
MTVGYRAREARKRLGITLEEVAKKVGVSRQTLSRYENSIIINIPSDRVELLADTLKTTPAYLMGWDEEKQPAPEIEDELEKEAMIRFETLSESQKSEALNYLRYLSENSEKK